MAKKKDTADTAVVSDGNYNIEEDLAALSQGDHPVPQAETPEAALTPADILRPTEWYTPAAIRWALGIRETTVIEAHRNREFREYRASREAGNTSEWLGRDILRWIERERIPCEVTREAAAAEMALREAARPKAPPPDPPRGPLTLAEAAIDDNNAILADEADHEARWRREAWSMYLKLLHEADAPVTADKRKSLASVMADLQITPDRLREDIRIAARAKAAQERYDSREAALAAAVKARDEHHAAAKEWEARERELFLKMTTAEGEARECGMMAIETLRQLARSRPELFDTGVSPPRLRQPEAVS